MGRSWRKAFLQLNLNNINVSAACGPYRKENKKTKESHYLRLTIVIHHVNIYCYLLQFYLDLWYRYLTVHHALSYDAVQCNLQGTRECLHAA